jgi:hypothetical protein
LLKMTRKVAALLGIVLLAIVTACTVAGVEPATPPPASANATASPQATESVSPGTGTAAPSPAAAGEGGQTSTESNFLNALTTLNNTIRSIWEILVGLAITLLVLWLAYRTIAEGQRFHLVFDELQNGTGDAAIKESLGGMEALLRDKLITQVKGLQKTIEDYAGRTSKGAEFPNKLPLPQEAQSTEALDKVVDALGDDSPRYIKPLLSLYRYLFPQRGMRIRMTLQHNGDTPGKIGMTFEFINLGDQRRSRVVTLWEEAPLEVEKRDWLLCKEAASDQETGEGQKAQTQTVQGQSWTLQVAQLLEKASLYQDALTYYEKALAEDNENQEIARALVACQNKQARRAGPAAAFTTASGLKKSQLLNAAVESYASIFPEQGDIQAARAGWQIALGLKEGPKGQAYADLAEAYFEKLDLHDEGIELYKLAVQEGNPGAVEALEHIQTAQANDLVAASAWLLENQQWLAAGTYLEKAVANVPNHAGAEALQAKLKMHKPAQENKESLAAFELGKLYLERGLPVNAKEKFEAALEKQPGYKEAEESLIEALWATHSLLSRFASFLDIALSWLAIELFRQETDRLGGDDSKGKTRKAQYHNFYGAVLLSWYEQAPSFLGLAEAEFRAAIQACPQWLQPYENLGDLHGLAGMNQEESAMARQFFEKALKCYDLALEKKVLDRDGALKDSTPTIRSRIRLDRNAVALLCCPQDPSPLWDEVRKAETAVRFGKKNLSEIPLKPDYAEVYSSLAGWYAIVAYRYDKSKDNCGSQEAPITAKAWAYFYLVCAGLLDLNRLFEATYDPFLSKFIPTEQFWELKNRIEIRQFRQEALEAPTDMQERSDFNLFQWFRPKPEEQPEGVNYTWKDVREALKRAGIVPPEDLPDDTQEQ